MIKNMLLLLLLLVILKPVYSQFNDQLARSSLVRVQVTVGNEKGILSGFFWKDPSQIITALHGMKPNGVIKLYFPNGAASEARVMKVLPEADLVLLKANSPPSGGFSVLNNYQPRVTTGEKLTAIGFYGGAQSKTTQSFDKGSADPETVQGIAPLVLESKVREIQFPSITFPIYYVSGGSLLPGFSGCPVYNRNMELIGIGDGGLDKGQTNVSWCIPATNISQLENSPLSALPSNLSTSGMNYTSDVSITENNSAGTDNNNNNREEKPQQYEAFASGDFNFYLTKTRSWDEVKQTSVNADNMMAIVNELSQSNLKVNVNEMYFDMYEDVNYGVVVTVPELAKLYVADKEKNIFGVTLSDLDLENDDANKYFKINYLLSTKSVDQANDLISFIKSGFDPQTTDVTINPLFSKTYKTGNEWTAEYRFFSANEPLNIPVIGQSEAFFYVCTIYNNEVAFNAIATAYIPTNKQNLLDAFNNGIDCVDNYGNNTAECDFFETMVKVFAAVHLTTISN